MKFVISRLCDISEKSYYVWKNKTHKNLITLIEKHFTKEDLEEFLIFGEISKYKSSNTYNPKNYKKRLEYLFKNKELIYKIAEIKTILGGKDA